MRTHTGFLNCERERFEGTQKVLVPVRQPAKSNLPTLRAVVELAGPKENAQDDPWYIARLTGEQCIDFFRSRMHRMSNNAGINEVVQEWLNLPDSYRALGILMRDPENVTKIIDGLIIPRLKAPLVRKIKDAYEKNIRSRR